MCRVILHVGQPKAGSTALQGAICSDLEGLRRARMFYPVESATASRRLDGRTVWSHNLLAGFGVNFDRIYAPLQQYYQSPAGLEAALAQFKADTEKVLAAGGVDLLILSGEMICEAPLEALVAIRTWLSTTVGATRIDVCLYVRSPVDAYASRLLQDVKTALGFTPPEAFLIEYDAQHRRLVEVFGASAVTLARFGCSSEGWDIAADFAGRYLSLPLSGERANESLAFEAMVFLESYWDACRNAGPLGRAKYELLVAWLECNPYIPAEHRSHRIKPSVAASIRNRHREQLAFLAGQGISFPHTLLSQSWNSATTPASKLADVFDDAPGPADLQAVETFMIDGLLHACIVMNEALNAR